MKKLVRCWDQNSQVLSYVDQFHADHVQTSSSTMLRQDVKWKLPQAGKLRLDVNATYDQRSGIFGVGIIVQNCSGEVVVAGLIRFGDVGSVACA